MERRFLIVLVRLSSLCSDTRSLAAILVVISIPLMFNAAPKRPKMRASTCFCHGVPDIYFRVHVYKPTDDDLVEETLVVKNRR
jgi:hypothetical protein